MASMPVVLVAVDGSGQSMNTVAYLGHVLSPQHLNLELFHVLPSVPETFFDQGDLAESAAYASEVGEWKQRRSSQIEQFMTDARTVLTDAGFSPDSVSTTVQPRKVGIARDIINRANAGYAAVVIGRKGYGSLPAYMLGSIAAKLADTVDRTPLVIVGGQPDPHKVMVAFDRSGGLRKGVERIAPLLRRSMEEILLCHIVRPLSEPHPARQSFFSSRNESHWLDENSRKIIPAMVAVKQHLSRSGFDQNAFCTAILKEKTSRADAILTEAEALGIGTIVVGRRGTTAVEDFVMGRVTRKVLHMAASKAIWIV